ncbi:outer membrane lipoprotein chaperone LolA [Blochmannia endosymbiont of Camponotus nipponensis]|uniref:outer membrane lipoprotein chaperone LolA n=1 Tax=Blochmannia endosymbiont of Camponotus nipponensis TaxID=2681986 RepID=UPI00135AD6E0|nr:outer membrane lipoprotein chaperone LolA [Blochmannia endosymbiont of Camponotus nipponensis]
MFKRVIYALFFNVVVVIAVVANDISVCVLQNRLKKINNFYAHFIQKVIDADSNMLLEAYGELWVKCPNLFNWHMISPEENFLISDGKTLWFYIPSLKQVTTYWLKNFSNNIFFMLFSNENMYKWDDYNVFQQEDFFSLIPIHNDISLKEYRIEITDCGTIKGFSFIEKQGQRVDYNLSEQNNNIIDIKKFYFVLSEDIQLDEQRK